MRACGCLRFPYLVFVCRGRIFAGLCVNQHPKLGKGLIESQESQSAKASDANRFFVFHRALEIATRCFVFHQLTIRRTFSAGHRLCLHECAWTTMPARLRLTNKTMKRLHVPRSSSLNMTVSIVRCMITLCFCAARHLPPLIVKCYFVTELASTRPLGRV